MFYVPLESIRRLKKSVSVAKFVKHLQYEMHIQCV